ncbi:glycoside hydrolase superfamily [Calycina marina]|uniref:Beta-hexosaminidase n=1 Tax=Calycina marina TaxID=1763456 RepID=A0A9P7Z171_9HELO|nr:glycoside hydrolase superfamily [Calycina marina]
MHSSSIVVVTALVLNTHIVHAIWPAPRSFSTGNTVLWIDPTIEVTYNGKKAWGAHQLWGPAFNSEHILDTQETPFGANAAGTISSDSVAFSAIPRALASMFKYGLIPWKLHPRNELSQFEPAADASKTFVTSLCITQKCPQNNFKPLAGEVDESYNLTISKEGEATIDAISAYGILHGLTSFIQLFYEHSKGGQYIAVAPVSIADAPKFKHRGLNLDVARNWYPVPDILRQIDALAWNKFNRLHIHMSDSQSWPMDIPSLPLLSRKGAYSPGLTYSPSDMRQIQSYAALRGVEVYIEFDMPGHTTSIAHGYPDLIAAANALPWETYCAEPPCGSLQLGNPAVPVFLQKLFDDVLPRVKPYSAYFHTGGDEVNKNTYLLDPTVKSSDYKVLQPLIQKFVDRNHDQIRKVGLTPVVWEEMLLDWNLTLPKDVVVQSWLSDESVGAIAKKGYKVLAGNYNYWYLDCGHGQWLNFDNGQSFQNFYPFNDYCSPLKNWRLVYAYDPLAGVAIEDQHLVLGGEVHMWSEQTDPVNLDSMLWPRVCAAGETLWSGRHDSQGNNRSQVDAAPRLAEFRERMVARGIRAGPVQMVYCTQGNGTTCSL